MTEPSRHDAIRDFLRRGDPAAGEPLEPTEAGRMRARILAEAGGDPAPSHASGRPARAALWAAACAVLLLVAAVVWRGRQEPAPVAESSVPSAAAVDAGDVVPANLRPARTIHFVTPSGTRVIWTLDPNFNLYPDEGPSRS
jgi:hypothetical protein